MIKIRLAENSDWKRWDRFILRSPKTFPYHLFAWKKAIETAYGHKCIYLYAEKNNEVCGIMPMVHIQLRGIINEIISLPFCDVGNCVAADVKVQNLLVEEAINYYKKVRGKKLQIRGTLLPSTSLESLLQPLETAKVRMVLDLPNSSDELFKSLKSKVRSQVRKAEKNGVKFYWGGRENIDKAYSVFSKNMHELGSPVHSKYFLSSVLSAYGANSRIGIAEFENKVIGVGIILLGGKGVSIPWASTLRKYNWLGPNMLLYWNFLKFSADNGYDFFDFGRSSQDGGTYKFKKQWGSKPTELVWYALSQTIEPKEAKKQISTDKREWIAATWAKIPYSVANMIGPHLRKYISL